MGEFDRIARLARRFGQPRAPAIGIGGDCAVLPNIGTATALTVDAAVEGVHFTRALLSLSDAAERAVETAVSDLAAVGARIDFDPNGGCGLLCAMTLPPELSEHEFDALIDGFARAAERAGAVVLGGNLASAPVLTITTTAVGRLEGKALSRVGARPGDRVYLSGAVGAAALGLCALRAKVNNEPEMVPFVRAWRAPRARLAQGLIMAKVATAAIDVSDGLAQDVWHLAQASECRIVLDAGTLPMLSGQREAALRLGLDPLHLALTGGEDYELCFTAPEPPPETPGVTFYPVGEVTAGNGVFVRDAGAVRPIEPRGWDHFR